VVLEGVTFLGKEAQVALFAGLPERYALTAPGFKSFGVLETALLPA
jgi:hypothetical protein